VNVERLGVAGAGTMGAGIAQLACLGGFETVLHDRDPEALDLGVHRLRTDLQRGISKGRWSDEEAIAAAERCMAAADLEGLAGCDLVIEAAPEQLELKRELFARLEDVCGDDAVLATNTSSLPVTEIAARARIPERICGMHFFNPPALMKLVEVVAGERSGGTAVDAVAAVAERMGRTAVRCADSPGFVVNRCNRPFALESLRILDEGIAGHAEIDRVMREDGGYRMGPFELMDLIGIDVNLSVARSFYAQRPIERWKPHPIQERMVAEGRLGRKTGRGFYDYGDAGATDSDDADPLEPGRRREILERVVAQLVNEAHFAAGEDVAAPDDIDIAMKLGLNHPRGPFEWSQQLGPGHVLATLERLRRQSGDERYEAAPLLVARAADQEG
jgi:3-hydroxybutyryl-CoA dehydrogenase